MVNDGRAPHRLLERDLLTQAGQTLYAVWRARAGRRPLVSATELSRLKHGTAGFATVVKMAQRLGLMVELRFGRPMRDPALDADPAVDDAAEPGGTG
jgi:hypothetical protein